MKKIILLFITILIIALGLITYNYFNNKPNSNPVIKNNNIENETIIENKYIDTNPIKLGLYKYYKRGIDRELITTYSSHWQYHKDISSFEVFYTNDEKINGNIFQDLFKEYYELYENVNNYKIGYEIKFETNDTLFHKTILSPKDTEEFYEYLEIYLYDDYHREKGVWYSHTIEKEMNKETLLTSIKLTAGKSVDKITSDILVTAYTYDEDDFDEEGFYRGISKYTITVKKNG